MDDDTLAEYEAEFTRPDIQSKDGALMCKDCGLEPAFSALCQECKEQDGTCLRCPRCVERECWLLATGFIELLHRSSTTGVSVDREWEQVCRGLSRHAMSGVIAALTLMVYDPVRIGAENGGMPVEEWLSEVRSAADE
jgi:hypothetical protein